MENDKITVVCPYCSKDMAVDAKEKNHKVTCIACSQSFIAYEALRCQKCGIWKHPNHACKEWGCNFDKDYSAGLWNYIENKEQHEQEKIRDAFARLPEDVQTVLNYFEKKIISLENDCEDLQSELEELKENMQE